MKGVMAIVLLLALLTVAWLVVRDVTSRRETGSPGLAVIDRAREGRERAEKSGREMEKALDRAAGE